MRCMYPTQVQEIVYIHLQTKATSTKCANKIHKLILYFNCGCDESIAVCNIVSHCVPSYSFSHFFFHHPKRLASLSLCFFIYLLLFDAKFCRALVAKKCYIRALLSRDAVHRDQWMCCNSAAPLHCSLHGIMQLAIKSQACTAYTCSLSIADLSCSFRPLWLDSRSFRQQPHRSI